MDPFDSLTPCKPLLLNGLPAGHSQFLVCILWLEALEWAYIVETDQVLRPQLSAAGSAGEHESPSLA